MKKIGIVCAGDDELEPFLSHIENKAETEKAMLRFYEGSIVGIPVVALYSGVCKVNAAIAAQILIDHFRVDIIINAGTAGGMDGKLELFDTVISTQMAYHDVAEDILTEFHPWLANNFFEADKDLLKIAQGLYDCIDGIYFGRMVTGEAFIEDNCREVIREKFLPLSVDMETASFAHACYVNKIPFIAMRTITDTASHSGIKNFEDNCKKASAISAEIVLKFLKEWKKNRGGKDEN